MLSYGEIKLEHFEDMESTEIGDFEIAKVEECDVRLLRKNFLSLSVTFNYAGSGHQGMGSYVVDTEFIQHFMEVLGIEKLRNAEGKYCLVESASVGVNKVAPIHPDQSEKVFDIEAWAEQEGSNLNVEDLERGDSIVYVLSPISEQKVGVVEKVEEYPEDNDTLLIEMYSGQRIKGEGVIGKVEEVE